jgi:hypothetical protein
VVGVAHEIGDSLLIGRELAGARLDFQPRTRPSPMEDQDLSRPAVAGFRCSPLAICAPGKPSARRRRSRRTVGITRRGRWRAACRREATECISYIDPNRAENCANAMEIRPIVPT